jgi:rhodanese-related sulfurtransferase
VLSLQAAGAQVLDTREPAEFAAAHLAGSVNVGLSGQYATWAGTVLDHDRPIVLVAAPGREAESAMRLGRIGFDTVEGYLADGLASLASRPELTRTTERVSPRLAAERVAEGTVLVDLRTQTERAAKYIPGSIGMPLGQLRGRLKELPRDQPLLLHCAGGYRSSIAASLLEREGFKHVGELAGGIAAWEQAGQALEPRTSTAPRS